MIEEWKGLNVSNDLICIKVCCECALFGEILKVASYKGWMSAENLTYKTVLKQYMWSKSPSHG